MLERRISEAYEFVRREKIKFFAGSTLALAALTSACETAETRTETPTVSPTAEAAKTPTPEPTNTPTPEPEPEIDPITQEFIDRVMVLEIHPDTKTEVVTALERIPTLSNEEAKFFIYAGSFNQLLGQYYANPNEETLNVLKNLRGFIQETYPDDFEARKERGLKNGFDPWEINEKEGN